MVLNHFKPLRAQAAIPAVDAAYFSRGKPVKFAVEEQWTKTRMDDIDVLAYHNKTRFAMVRARMCSNQRFES